MWNVLLTCAVVSVLVRPSWCIECYSCISNENPDCEDPVDHRLEKVKCDMDTVMQTKTFAEGMDPVFAKVFEVHIHTGNVVPYNCLKQVTKVQGETIILRGCQLPREGRLDVCTKVFEIEKKESIDIEHCSLCEGDVCNGATPATPTTCGKLIAISLALLLKYVTQ